MDNHFRNIHLGSYITNGKKGNNSDIFLYIVMNKESFFEIYPEF